MNFFAIEDVPSTKKSAPFIRKIKPIIKKINIDTHLSFSSKIYSLIEKMETAYDNSDYGLVTTLSSTILQNVFIEICKSQGITVNKNEKFNALYNKVKSLLNIDPV